MTFNPRTAKSYSSKSTLFASTEQTNYDFDVAIIGCGVGGHGAALHARGCDLKTAIFTGNDVGGTCVNRGCVPSKALLAASGRVRDISDKGHLSKMGVNVEGEVKFDRQMIADHAKNLASKVKANLEGSLKALKVDIIPSSGTLAGPNKIRGDDGKIYTAKDIILAPGSLPFVPPGITVDEKTVYTSDGALNLDFIPEWVAIIGSGYIGLEFSDVYTALGSEVTFIEALPNLMPTFDKEIAKQAEKMLLRPRAIDSRKGVFASEVTPGIPGKKPCTIKMIDAITKEHKETIEVDAVMVATGRVPNTKKLGLEAFNVELKRGGFVPVNEQMQVLDKEGGKVIDNVYCIGDANGVMMLAHAASAQGISAIENIKGREHKVNHLSVPAACFTHPEISMVGLTEEQAVIKAEKEGWTLGKSVSNFRANSKALAEDEANGIAKILYNKETGLCVGAHIIGIHAADLIQECAMAIETKKTVKEMAFMVHTHPTLCEVLDEAWKGANGMSAH